MLRERCVLGLLLLGACQHPAQDGSASDDVKAKKLDELSIPGAELSGLALRNVGTKHELLAITDGSYLLQVGQLEGTKLGKVDFASVDLAPALADYTGSAGSQWEAVASDASGRVFVLEENPGRLFVFDSRGAALEHVVELVVPDQSELAQDWSDDPNSRGEGFVLLQNGHVLVSKEKSPRALVEFGPEGDAAEGFRRDLATGSDGEFPLPAGKQTRFVALKSWSLGKPNKLADLSELALAPTGALYVLSDQGRALGRLVDPIEPDRDEAIEIEDVQTIPDADKPEGLVFLTESRAVVVSDQKKSKDNAVLVEVD